MGIVRTVVIVSAPIWFILYFYQRSRRGDKNGQSVDIGNIDQYWTQDTDRRQTKQKHTTENFI